jgi:hypothetical protein
MRAVIFVQTTSTSCEINSELFLFGEDVILQSTFLEPDLDCEEMGLKFLGGYSGITVRDWDGCIVCKCGYDCWGSWKVRGVHEV